MAWSGSQNGVLKDASGGGGMLRGRAGQAGERMDAVRFL